MSENLRNFTTAVYGFDAVVQRTPAEAWDAQSACPDWSGRELLQHQCAVLNGVAEMARTGAMAKPTPPEDMSDPVATWNQCRTELLEALDQPGAINQAGPFWFDTATIDDTIGVVMWDPLAHTWDLAACSGTQAVLDESVCETAAKTIHSMQPMLEETGRTGPPVAVADDAPAWQRFLGATGRNPA